MRLFGLLMISGLLGLAAPTGAMADCLSDGSLCGTQNGEYRIRMPEGPGPHPAVVYLYGSLGNSAEKMGYDNFVRAFTDRGFAVIVPAGLNKRYVGGIIGSGWFLRNSRAPKDRDDAAFVAEVLDDAASRQFIIRNRVLMAGMSNGAFLAWEIACHEPHLAAAYAPVAGGYLGKMPSNCSGPVKILHTHGRSDNIVPLNPDKAWRSGGESMMPLDDSLDQMAREGGCGVDPVDSRFREYDRREWRGCESGASVSVLIHDGGHTIPFSWYPTVMDWFEREVDAPADTGGGGVASFKPVGGGAGERTLGGGSSATFKSVGGRVTRSVGSAESDSGPRFKSVRKVPPQ